MLDAAVQSFAENGVAATSLSRLAAEIGVTPAMLNYYFGRKEQLREAVFSERLMPVFGILQRKLDTSADTATLDVIRLFVVAVHEIVAAHPWLPALWVREVLTDGGQFRNDFIAHLAPVVTLPLIERLTQAQRRGQLNADLDPRLLFVSLLGLTMFPLAAAPIWRPGLAASDINSEQLLDHTISLLRNGVMPGHGA
jgi:AcrR family transcriptional regulator